MNLVTTLATLHALDAAWWADGAGITVAAEHIPPALVDALWVYRPMLMRLAGHTADAPWPRAFAGEWRQQEARNGR